jgi:hypothetical protein
MSCISLFVNGHWREYVYLEDAPEVGETIPITFVKADHSIGICELRVKEVELTTDLEENPIINAYGEEIK